MNAMEYPALYRDTEAASLRAQRHYLCAVLASMVLLVSSALVSLIESSRVWFALFQAGAVLGSLAVTVDLAQQQPQKVWYSMRALAESVKSSTWRFVMRAKPYDVAEVVARATFVSDLGEMVRDDPLRGHALAYGGGDQITSGMTEIRNRPLEDRKHTYDGGRIRDQLEWYRGKTQLNGRLATRWFVGLIALQCLAVSSALARFAFPAEPQWPTAFFAAAAAAALAWTQAKRFRENAASYGIAAHEISLLRARLLDVSTEQELSSFVVDAEDTFSREHLQWQGGRPHRGTSDHTESSVDVLSKPGSLFFTGNQPQHNQASS